MSEQTVVGDTATGEQTSEQRGGERSLLAKIGVREVGAAVLVLVAVGWIFPAPGYWIFTANSGLILAAAALGLMVVVGWTREVSLAQAGLTGTAMFITAFAYRGGSGWGWPYLAAVAFGIAVVVALSVLVALATARLSGIYILILTLALQVTIEKTFFTHQQLIQADPTYPVPRPSLLGVHLDSDRSYYLFSLVVVAILMLFLARLRASRFGRGLILAGTDRQAASSVGVSPWRAKIFAFALAGLCAGVAGAITAPLYTTPPSFIAYVSLYSLFYLAIPVLAGFRSILGVAGVAMLFSVVPQALEHYRISPLFLGGFGLMLGTMAGPAGLSGLAASLLKRYRDHRLHRESTIDVSDAGSFTEPAEAAEVRTESYQRALEVLEEYLPRRVGEGDVLVADGVSVAFGGLKALEEVSVSVPARHLVGLIGPNGAGKSTLFDVINGLRKPDAGRISLFGQDVTSTNAWDRAARGLSRTFQASRVNLDLSVGANLLAGAYNMIPGNVLEAVFGLARARAGERRAEEAGRAVAELLDLSPDWDELVGNLDFGRQRRVEIGRSLMSGPRVLLLDEPSAGLDANEANALFRLVRRLEEDLGLTVVLVEHYVKAVLENCDKVYVLSQGRIIAVGTPDEIANHPQVQAVYLGQSYQKEAAHVDA